MPENSVLFPSMPAIHWTEAIIVLTIASIAYFLVFNNFEKHLIPQRRVTKLLIVVGTPTTIGILFGRATFWIVIALMTVGQVILHGWFFPKHGINGLTAEPYEKYLETIEKMKGKK